MAGFVQTENRIRVCGGSCGRMTRPSKVMLADAPGTVGRLNLSHCAACVRHEQIEAGTVIPGPTPEALAAKEKLVAERVAAAHRAREVIERQRQERQRKAGRAHLAAQIVAQRMGQSMVRI